MKSAFLFVILAVVACQLTAARTISTDPAVWDCAVVTVDDVKAKVVGRVDEVVVRLDVFRNIYNQCLTRPEDQIARCMTRFNRYTTQFAQELFAGIDSNRDEMTAYILDQLEDYYNCRLDSYADVMKTRQATTCALNLLEATRQEFAVYINLFLSHIGEARASFAGCLDEPVVAQAHCVMKIFDGTQGMVTHILDAVQERREQIIGVVSTLLDSYYNCRLPQKV